MKISADAQQLINIECPFCSRRTLVIIKGREPYNVDHLQCTECDSTFGVARGDDDGG